MDSPRKQKTEGGWKQFKGRMKEAWGAITDDEVDRFEGRRDQLEGYIQERTGEAREDIRRKMDQFSSESKYDF
jgi:uncharacterized protein YjbJ (UPF0337 family)